jgi:hypothetical protein
MDSSDIFDSASQEDGQQEEYEEELTAAEVQFGKSDQ